MTIANRVMLGFGPASRHGRPVGARAVASSVLGVNEGHLMPIGYLVGVASCVKTSTLLILVFFEKYIMQNAWI